ncbi:MAG: hypothetical protein WAW06_02855 [bacterium]
MAEIKSLDALHPSVRSATEAYCGRILTLAGPRVKAISAYGSATGPDFLPGRSNVNLVLVLDSLRADALRPLLGVVKSGARKRIVPPLVVTPEYLEASLDVFPIEYLEIAQTQAVLVGDDFFGGLAISGEHLRLECESRLRVACLRTRQAYLEIGLARRGPEQVLHASATSIVPVLRAVLKLKGAEAPERKVGIVEAAGRLLGMDLGILVAVLRDKAGDEKILGRDSHRVLAEYLDALEALTGHLDRA